MKTITQYREDINELMKKIGDIKARCEQESRDPTPDELDLQNKMLDRIKGLRQIIATMEKIELTQGQLEKSQENIPKPNPDDNTDIRVGDDRASKDKFLSFGEMLVAVRKAGIPGGYLDPRLIPTEKSYRTADISGLSESVSSDGGFLVQQEFSQELLRDIFETGLLAARCKQIEIGAGKNGITINGIDETSRADASRWGGIQAHWEAEALVKPKSKPKFRQIDLKLKKLVGLCYATDELLEDATALGSIIKVGFAEEFNFKLDDAIIRGTGAGMPLGIVNSPVLISVAKETGQKAATIVYKNIVNMWSRLLASSRINAIWVINQDVEPALQSMEFPVGTGGVPAYLPPSGVAAAPYSSLFGRPVVPLEQCETLGTKGDIMLCDFSKYILAKKGGIRQDMSIHVRFIYDESVFRFVLRIDGQPIRSTAITPYKGNNTLSHFVALDTRG